MLYYPTSSRQCLVGTMWPSGYDIDESGLLVGYLVTNKNSRSLFQYKKKNVLLVWLWLIFSYFIQNLYKKIYLNDNYNKCVIIIFLISYIESTYTSITIIWSEC